MQKTLGAAVILCCGCVFAQQPGPSPAHPCLPCHPREVQRFTQSPMGRSLSTPADEPDGHFVHQASGSTVTIFRDSGAMHHKIEERGLTADYPIAYSVGYGSVGRSYLIELGGHLFQSPAAFYTARSEWDSSPGYETERILDFNRPIASDCLVCHAGAMRETAGKTTLSPIGCDRCHGDAENHLRNPVPGSIVNPAKLATRERDSVCEQCHLESATVVLNPNHSWWDFRPGQRLEKIETYYVYRAASGDQLPIGAVSQAEQLALSVCARASAGKLWCGTCHDPHGEPSAPTDRRRQIQQICESCHSPSQVLSIHKGVATPERTGGSSAVVRGPDSERTGGSSAVVRGPDSERTGGSSAVVRGPDSERTGGSSAVVRGPDSERTDRLSAVVRGLDMDCVSCHMPRRQAVDVSHAAITDHRIAKHPAEIRDGSLEKILSPWHDPEPELARRNLGLAYFNLAKREGSAAEFEKAFALLSSLPLSEDDPVVSATLGYMLLGSGRAQASFPWFERALARQPESAEYWLDIGVAKSNAGDIAGAIASLRRSIEANPYDYRPYKALSDLYASQHQPQQSEEVLNSFLRLMPQSILLRLR